MVIITSLLATAVLQLAAYSVLEKFGFRDYTPVILLICLLAYGVVLPWWFQPPMRPGGINCGNAQVGITLAFWMGGGLATLSAHGIYRLLRR